MLSEGSWSGSGFATAAVSSLSYILQVSLSNTLKTNKRIMKFFNDISTYPIRVSWYYDMYNLVWLITTRTVRNRLISRLAKADVLKSLLSWYCFFMCSCLKSIQTVCGVNICRRQSFWYQGALLYLVFQTSFIISWVTNYSLILAQNFSVNL